MASTSTRGMDPPAENWTFRSDRDDEKLDDSKTTEPPQADEIEVTSEGVMGFSVDATDKDSPDDETMRVVEPMDKKDTDDVSNFTQTSGEPTTSTSTTSKKPKRTSYSKDLLNPTQQGSLIQAGIDPNSEVAKKEHKPAYVSKQLKPTGYGDKIKQGAEVPRDHIEQPVDPNDKLADVYKNQSTKFKSTGFAEQLKQGADVPRDHIPPVEDPNDKLADMYKSVNFRPTGLGDKLKQGEDVRPARVKENANQAEPIYASLKLKKAGNPEEKKPTKTNDDKKSKILASVKLQKTETIVKDPSTLKSTLPEVKLHKTAPVIKESKAASFELPEEFSAVKQNLKRRTERHWYSGDIPQAKPTKKWFFQRGEWNDGATSTTTQTNSMPAKESSWFFGSSTSSKPDPMLQNKTPAPAIFRGSKTMLNTPKPTVQHFHKPNTKKNKNLVTPFNKNYYDEIQRRRGLVPKRSRLGSLLWKFFVFFVVVPLIAAPALYYTVHNHPDQVKQFLDKVAPHVEPALVKVQPHFDAAMVWSRPHVETAREAFATTMDQVLLHVDSIKESAHPFAVASVNRVCSPVEAFVLPENHEKWMGSLHKMAVSSCKWMRTQLTTLNETSGALAQEDSTIIDTSSHEINPTPKKHPTSRRVKVHVDHDDNPPLKDVEDTCDCDMPQPKGLHKLLNRIPGRKKHKVENSCLCGAASAH